MRKLQPVVSDPFFDRQLPCALDTERVVLGSIMMAAQCLWQAVEHLKRDDFFLDSHRKIFDKMLALGERNAPIDLVTLTDQLKRAGELEQVGGQTYLASLIDGVPRTDNIAYYCGIIKSKANLRRLITASNNAIAAAFDEEEETSQIIDNHLRAIYRMVEDSTPGRFRHVKTLAQSRLEALEAMQGRTEMITGVPTGFTYFDQMTAGLQKEDLIIIAARPSVGKTALALNIAQYAAKNGTNVGIFSLEMSGEQLVTRLLCSDARVDAHRLRTGYLNREEWARLADALRRFEDTQIHIEDSAGLTAEEIAAKSRQKHIELMTETGQGFGLLIVDYLQLMGFKGNQNINREQQVASQSKDLKKLAKDLGIPVIALSQLSRRVDERADHRPVLSDLRESGSLEQDSDVVAFIYRAEMYNQSEENRGTAELIIGKQRNGPTGSVQLCYLREFTRFENLWRD